MVGFKAAIGDLDPKQREEMELLPFMNDLNSGPFMEASLGVENIFKVMRVDAVRRLTYLDLPNARPWSLRLKLNITF